jgi:hypothetical protein
LTGTLPLLVEFESQDTRQRCELISDVSLYLAEVGIVTKLVHKQYYLVPWEPIADVAIKITRASYALKQNCVMCLSTTANVLSGVEDDATLLIDGHGSTSDPFTIEADVPSPNPLAPAPVRAHRTCAQLAILISEFWKLPKTHVKIRMLSCHGFGFARNLAIELGKDAPEFGRVGPYQSIVVSGYLHSVSTGAGRSPVTGRGTNAMIINDEFKFKGDVDLPENQRILWFNGNGDVVTKPQFQKTISVVTDEYG